MSQNYHYDTAEQLIELEGINIRLSTVLNPETLFDQLLEKGDVHDDVISERIPYWAELWPASKAMGIFLLRNPELIAGKTVLEVGCGLGLAGISAKFAGGMVTMSDYLPEATAIAESNWKLNFTEPPDVQLLDWNKPDTVDKYDVIIASDVLYDRSNHAPISKFADVALKSGGIVIFSDPKRSATRDFFKIQTVKDYSVRTFEVMAENSDNKTVPVDIYLLQKMADL